MPGAIDDFLQGKHPEAVRLFRKFEQLVQACGPSQEYVLRTVVYFKRRRVFAGAFIRGKRLELILELLRTASHPQLITSYRGTKKVMTHRLRISNESELDAALADLIRESYETVGPGTRAAGGR